jgi:hypothetical protein
LSAEAASSAQIHHIRGRNGRDVYRLAAALT